ncbi:hypothetical protein IT570_00750 [Candidatus Sumerlaeota bacterium]|nr:hypothetical protein [Candidatus Sumerlaeota bacterium]
MMIILGQDGSSAADLSEWSVARLPESKTDFQKLGDSSPQTTLMEYNMKKLVLATLIGFGVSASVSSPASPIFESKNVDFDCVYLGEGDPVLIPWGPANEVTNPDGIWSASNNDRLLIQHPNYSMLYYWTFILRPDLHSVQNDTHTFVLKEKHAKRLSGESAPPLPASSRWKIRTWTLSGDSNYTVDDFKVKSSTVQIEGDSWITFQLDFIDPSGSNPGGCTHDCVKFEDTLNGTASLFQLYKVATAPAIEPPPGNNVSRQGQYILDIASSPSAVAAKQAASLEWCLTGTHDSDTKDLLKNDKPSIYLRSDKDLSDLEWECRFDVDFGPGYDPKETYLLRVEALRANDSTGMDPKDLKFGSFFYKDYKVTNKEKPTLTVREGIEKKRDLKKGDWIKFQVSCENHDVTFKNGSMSILQYE